MSRNQITIPKAAGSQNAEQNIIREEGPLSIELRKNSGEYFVRERGAGVCTFALLSQAVKYFNERQDAMPTPNTSATTARNFRTHCSGLPSCTCINHNGAQEFHIGQLVSVDSEKLGEITEYLWSGYYRVWIETDSMHSDYATVHRNRLDYI